MIYKMFKKALCDDATSRTQTSEWYSCFKGGQTLVEDFERANCLSSSWIHEYVEKVCQVNHEDDGV